MKSIRTGIILKTENFTECVGYYKNIIGLSIEFVSAKGDFKMTQFDFGGSYLLVETGGISKPGGKNVLENPSVLRLDVEDIYQVASDFNKLNLEVQVDEYDWGNIIIIFDPDGNRIHLTRIAKRRNRLMER